MAPQVFTQSAATAFLVAYNDSQVSEGRHGFAEVLVSLLRAPAPGEMIATPRQPALLGEYAVT
jgi:hypothetical protein